VEAAVGEVQGEDRAVELKRQLVSMLVFSVNYVSGSTMNEHIDRESHKRVVVRLFEEVFDWGDLDPADDLFRIEDGRIG